MMRDADERTLLKSLHSNRLNDLALRAEAGHLTAVESLALAQSCVAGARARKACPR